MECLQHAGIPAGIVQNAEDLVHDPHLIDRQFWLSLNHPVLGRMLGDRFPARFACGETEDWRPAPQLGEDNRYVFRDILKLTEEEFIQAKRKGLSGNEGAQVIWLGVLPCFNSIYAVQTISPSIIVA